MPGAVGSSSGCPGEMLAVLGGGAALLARWPTGQDQDILLDGNPFQANPSL